jgi:hypothetical protein
MENMQGFQSHGASTCDLRQQQGPRRHVVQDDEISASRT